MNLLHACQIIMGCQDVSDEPQAKQHISLCACMYVQTRMHTQHTYTTAVRKSLHSSNHNHRIYQTPQAGSIITDSAVFKCTPLRLQLQIRGRIVIVLECKLLQSHFLPLFHKELFFLLLSYFRLDSLLINHNYFF